MLTRKLFFWHARSLWLIGYQKGSHRLGSDSSSELVELNFKMIELKRSIQLKIHTVEIGEVKHYISYI